MPNSPTGSPASAPTNAPPDSRARAVVRAPDFPPGFDWLFTPEPLTLAALRGRVVVVDLWTYGCINCQHVLATLTALEARFPRELVVVGVHSGKFIAERETARIAHAAQRLGAGGHPVVNDRQFRLWRAWAARGWPTLAVIDPRGYVVWQQAGEPRLEALVAIVADVVTAADAAGTLDRMAASPLDMRAAAGEVVTGAGTAERIRYPGGLAVSDPDARGVRRMAVASNGNGGPGARILVGRLTERGRRLVVEHEFDGAGDPFVRPQGLVFARDTLAADGGPATLYVADTGTHRLRAVDLATGATRVVAGTGTRVRTARDRAAGAMASPWGLLTFDDGILLVAMAGTHELWRVDPHDGTARVVAGGRGEGLVDAPAGTPARDALLAQPVALATDGVRVWWADAEASAVRETTRAALEGDAHDGTRTLVGTGLFDFGDRDGVGDEVRLQHPQGVAWVGGRVLVADSYNDALKAVEPGTRRVETVARGFAEPGALAGGGESVFVADTNAHGVRGWGKGEGWEVRVEG